MTSSFKHPPGFTLIEMLVVMVIASVGLSLVGPRVYGIYEKIAQSAEEQRLAELMGAVSMRAFCRQVDYTILLADQRFTIKELETTVDFEHITFNSQTLVFNGNGYSDTREIQYRAGQQEKSLYLDWNGSPVGPG